MTADLARFGGGTVAALAAALAKREVSSVELTQAYLARMAAHRDLNAFVDTDADVSLAQARAADARRAAEPGTAPP